MTVSRQRDGDANRSPRQELEALQRITQALNAILNLSEVMRRIIA